MSKLSDLTPDQLAALRRFRAQHGAQWKYKLSGAWATGTDERLPDGALLRQIRNEHGPMWLVNLKERP